MTDGTGSARQDDEARPVTPDATGTPAATPGPAAGTPAPADAPGSAGARLDAALLGGPRTLSMRDLAERAGVDVELVRLYWRTLGLPHPDADDAAFTVRDADALGSAAALLRDGRVSGRTMISLTRALGHTSDRLALWQVEALVEDVATRRGLDDPAARRAVLEELPVLAPVLEAQLLHSYRRHLASIASRYAVEFAAGQDREGDPAALPLARAVGFADMVSFTRRTAGLGSTDLSDFVQRFETIARDVVTQGGGRVVKTIGDAVLFVADDVRTGARVALELARVLGGELDVEREKAAGGLAEGARGVTPVRVGVVWGRVLSRFGDVFGPSVNVAARLTDIADPSTVLTDPATARLLVDVPGLVLEPLPERELEGIGALAPVRVRTA